MIFSKVDDWRLASSYIIFSNEELVKRNVGVTYLGSDTVLLSGVDFIVPLVMIGKPEDCIFEAPGWPLKPHYPLAELTSDIESFGCGHAPHFPPD